MSLLDLPNAPKLNDNWPDLRDMSRVDMTALVRDMTTANVVVAVYPEGDYTILRGEQKLRRIRDSGEADRLVFLVVRVANDQQAEMVAAALRVSERGKMTPEKAETLRAMLTSVQDMSGRTH